MKSFRHFVFLLLGLLIHSFDFLSSSSIFAQTATLRGFVYTKENGEAAIYSTCILKGTKYGAITDLNGYYSVPAIPPGNYTLVITSLGYDSLILPFTFKANDFISKKFFLSKSNLELKEIEISGTAQAKKTTANVSAFTVKAADVNRVVAVGGTPDIAQYLQVLPGVISTGDQGGQLYIRGGSPVQNQIIQDGMIIYNPFHSIGLFSVFDMDAISSVNIYAGGFGAQYGGRISSVMDFTTKDGNKQSLSGNFTLSPFIGHLFLEGPLFKAKEESGSSGSYILSVKTSLLPETSKMLYSYVNSNGLPFNFTDLYGKVSLSTNTGSKINFFGMHYSDEVNYPNIANFAWTNNGFGTNFVVIPQGSPVLIQGNFAFSNYATSMSSSSIMPNTSTINSFNLGTKMTYFLDHKNILNYGAEIVGNATSFDFFNSVNEEINDQGNSTELAGYVGYKYVSSNEKLVFEPSFRAQYYGSLSEFSPEPRANLKYNFTDKIRFKAACGMYSQNLISTSTSVDVVNLFYGYLATPQNLQSTFTTSNGNTLPVTSSLEKATHFIAGFEFDIYKHISVTIEAYRKNLNQLIEVNPNKIYQDNGESFNNNQPEYYRKDFIVENGYAQGLDVTFKYDYKHVYVWATYSLASVNLWDGMQQYVPIYDRQHTINLVGSYTFGRKSNWEVNGRWNYGSGFPFTPTQGFYEKVNLTNLNSSYTTTNGTLGILFGPLDSKRLPDCHRFDLSLKRKFLAKKNRVIAATFSVTNVYNRENIFYIDRITSARIYQLPILPTFSFGYSF